MTEPETRSGASSGLSTPRAGARAKAKPWPRLQGRLPDNNPYTPGDRAHRWRFHCGRVTNLILGHRSASHVDGGVPVVELGKGQQQLLRVLKVEPLGVLGRVLVHIGGRSFALFEELLVLH